MKKIIYIITIPYWKRDHHRYGAEYLMSKGYHVEIWRMITAESFEFDTQAGMYEGRNLYKYTWDEFKKQAKANRNAIFILFNLEKRYTIYLAANKYNYIIQTGLGGVIRQTYTEYLPEGKNRFHFVKYVTEKVLLIKEIGIVEWAKKHMEGKNVVKKRVRDRQYIQLHPPTLIITSTAKLADRYLIPEAVNNNVMRIHSMDYDRVIEAERILPSREKKCIVYCDSGYANIDYDTMLYSNGVTVGPANHRDEYYDQLEELFVKLENYYHVPVVVAGHPHTLYGEKDFHGREIVFNKIAELSRDAVAFLLNTSTAMSFAEIYDIPTLKIVNQRFKDIPYPDPNCYDFIQWEANILGCGFLDMHDKSAMKHPWDYIKQIDRSKRKQYMEEYIIDSNITEKTTYECLEEYIRGLT